MAVELRPVDDCSRRSSFELRVKVSRRRSVRKWQKKKKKKTKKTKKKKKKMKRERFLDRKTIVDCL
jgi:hypothetical protein